MRQHGGLAIGRQRSCCGCVRSARWRESRAGCVRHHLSSERLVTSQPVDRIECVPEL